MRRVRWIVIGFLTLTLIVSCKNEEQYNAEKRVSNYKKFVDSIQVISTEKAVQNWDSIQYQNDQKKLNAEIALNLIENKKKIEGQLNQSTIEFELFKSKIVIEREKIKLKESKILTK